MVWERYIKRSRKIYDQFFCSHKVNVKIKTLIIILAIILLISFFILNYKNITGFGVSENQVEKNTDSMRFVIKTINAEHLNNNKDFISNIHNEVKELDDVWSETISDEHYIRVTFEQNLKSENDITIYPRVVSGNPRIEVYEKDSNTKIAEFPSINSNEYNKVYLTNLEGEQDTFDLKVIGGSIEFDYLIDPFTARTEQNVQGSSLSSPYNFVVNKATGTVDGDIMFMFLTTRATTSIATVDSVPDGWTLIAYNTVVSGTSYMTWYLYYKIASGEGDSYTWSLSKSTRYSAVNTAYSSGNFDVQSIDDITVSNTTYGTAGTAVRAASMNVPSTNSPLVFFGGVYTTTIRAFTEPSVPDTWVEDYEYGSTTSDISGCIDSMIWTGSGNTGDMDATCSASITTVKHAFAVALNPPAGDTEYPQFSSLTETPSEAATYSSGQNYQFNATIISTNSTAGIEFNGKNYTATNLSNIFSVTISDLSVGNYTYYWWAFGNGTSNNFNNSDTYSYNISKAVPQGSISGTSPIIYGTAGDVEGSESNSGDGDINYKLYRNNIEVSNPDTTTLGVGAYNYIYNATSGANYTANASIGTFSLTVNQDSSQTSLTFDKASSQDYGTEITPTCSIITGQGNAILTMDGDLITSGNALTLGVGTYTFNCSLAESQNYTASENVSDFTIDKAVPAGSLDSSAGWTIAYLTETTISLSESNPGDGDVTYIIYRDGVSINTGETISLSYGTYDYVLNSTGGANYTTNASIDSQTLTVNKNAGTCDILFNETFPLTYPAKFKVYSNCGSDFTLYRNGTEIENNSEQVLSAGIYNFTVQRTDNINYSNIYDEELFTIDQTTGQVNGFINNTQSNFTAVDGTANKNIYLNATLTSPCTGTGGIVINGTIYNTGTLPLYNITNLSVGFYNATFNYNGNTNCSADTEVWWINITEAPDNPPTINITYPENTTYNIDITQLNYTANDDISLSTCWYSLDGGATNSTPDATCSNFTGLESDEGSNTWTVYVNDSKGQESSDSATFTKDITYPVFSNFLRNPDTPNEDQDVQVNVTITETNLYTVILELNGETNYTVTTNNENEYYFTIAKGNYTAHDSVTYYWYANDSIDNLNKSSQQSFTITNQIPSVSAPAIDDTTPQTDDIISCDEGSFSDDDAEDSEQARYFKWYNNDVEISGQTSQTLDLSVSDLDKTDEIKCSIKVYDGYNNSSWVNSSDSAIIQNSPPTITNPQITIIWNVDGSTFNHDYEATDPDTGDSFTWYDNTTLFDINSETGVISDTPSESEAGTYSVLINVSDGTDQDTDEFTYTINDITFPTISIIYPENISYTMNVSELNYTYTETNPNKCWYSTDNGETNSSTQTCGTNFTDVISTESSNTWTIYINDTSGNENSSSVTFNKDTVYPSVTINSPLNQTYNTNSITFNITATDSSGISSCLYSLDAGVNSYSMSQSGNYWTITNSSMNQGSHTINFYCNDTTGNLNDTEQVTFFIDIIYPIISFTTGTENNDTTFSRDWIFVNVSVTEDNEDTIIFILYNQTSLVNQTSYTDSTRTINWTNLPDERYYYNVTVNDTAGNSNSTETREIILDTQGPQVTSLTETPTDPADYSQTSIYEFNATITDPSIDSVLFEFDGMNYTPNNIVENVYGYSITNLGVGTYNYRWFANDSFGNINNSENGTYIINQATPSLSITITPDETVEYGTETTATGSGCPTEISCTLHREHSPLNNPDTQTLGVGTYNYTFNTTGNANYTSTSNSKNLIITQSDGLIFLYIDNSRANKTIEQYTEIYLNASLQEGQAGENIKLYNNGTLISQGTSPLSDLTNFTIIGLYNITATYEGNTNYTSNSETWWVNVTEADITPPNINVTYPTNNSYDSVQTQLNYTTSDNFGLEECWYSTNNGETNTTITCGQNITELNSGQGSLIWTVWANDAKGNENSSSATFFVDSIFPEIQFVAPTKTNDSSTAKNLIEINVSADDANLNSIIIRLYNSTDLVQSNISSTSPYYINYTGLSAGIYYYNATVNDTLNNQESTETRTITLILPLLTIIKPKNQTYMSNKNLPLHYSAEYEDSVWYNLDMGGNTTVTGNTIFDVSSEGSHTLYLYANNSNGEIERNVTFTIDSTKFKVHYDKYTGNKKGNSTDFNVSSYEELQNLSEVTLEDTDYGKIEFNEIINLTDDENPEDDEIDLDSCINISNNKIEINSSALPNFNKSATLYFYDLTFTNPRILRDGIVCPTTICTQESYTGGDLKTLKFNVTGFTVYSVEETPSEAGITPGGGGGRGGKKIVYECIQDSDCKKEDEVCWNNKCTKLFDIKIIDFESPAKLGEFFDFTYFIKGMANISGDVEINFWIENSQSDKITSGSDVIYLGKFEEKTEITKIFLPTNVESGVYQFFIQVNYETYNVKAHRTIEIEVKGEGVSITSKEEFKIPVVVIIGIIIIILVIIGIIKFAKSKEYKRKKQKIVKKETPEKAEEKIDKDKSVEQLLKEIDTKEKPASPETKPMKVKEIKIIKPKQPPKEKKIAEKNKKQNFRKQSKEKTREELDKILDQIETQNNIKQKGIKEKKKVGEKPAE